MVLQWLKVVAWYKIVLAANPESSFEYALQWTSGLNVLEIPIY